MSAAPHVATLTLNPSLDVSYEFPSLIPDQKVHAQHTRFDPGGNGINVGRALKRLGVRATTVALLGGEIGLLVRRLLENEVEDLEAVNIPAETRINCTLLEKAPRTQYEVDGGGPAVPQAALAQVAARVEAAARGGFAVLTGSLPPGVPVDIYARLARQLHGAGVRVLVDSHGEMLRAALQESLFLIKPNRYELEHLAGRHLPALEDVLAEARRLQGASCRYVCVSLGSEGAVLVGPEGAFRAVPPQIEARSTVGAGDSLVGGLVAAFVRGASPAEALRLGVACGTATAAQPGTALFTPEQLETLAPRVRVARVG